MKVKLIEISMAIGIVLTVMVSCLVEFKSTYDSLQENVLRMHILANSDSQEDQELKLKVRDALLESSEEIFGDCSNIDDAEAQVSQKLDLIQQIAQDVVIENGYDYTVQAELTNMQFDDRTYDSIIMPSGYYDAIRVTIGSAEGHNWWCVMYPAMCVSAVSGDTQDVVEDYFDDDTVDILENHERYELKFKCVEWLEDIYKR
ncbi:MAG: stage II sporulation protein R [Ruminococcus sp.]|nr:stage II sporulation protein R [Ruminococcus sp.]MCD7800457.1 stage II sporulation protein R [Ruminococcus sp.]